MDIPNKIAELLQSPPNKCRPFPFWFWNANLSAEEITWQLEECRRQKIFTVLIHPRHGLVTPYLGDEFMAMVVHTVKEAARLGMKVWLYDEYNWPSGIVAGWLLREYPQYRMKFLHHEYRQEDGGQAIGGGSRREDVLAVQAVDLDSGDIRTVTGGDTLPAGRWGVGEFALQYPTIALDSVIGHSHTAPEYGYLDILNPNAVSKFIERTHEVYYRHLREYFGSVILGFFTDEPGVIYDFDYCYDFGHSMTHNLPWTASLDAHFCKVKGYSLSDRLIHLIADVPNAEATRKDYWDVVSDLYASSYHSRIADWCKQRGVMYTGHVVCEEMSLHYQGDLHKAVTHFDIPGTDWTSKNCTPDSAMVYSTAKIVSSVADRYCRPFTLCENYAATGWDLTLNDMKHIHDYLYVLGINQMCLHGFFYSVRGARSHECAPSEFFQSPWWKYMSTYSDYTARLGALLTLGRRHCSLGLLIPNRSYQSQNNRTFLDPDGKPAFYAKSLDRLFRCLLDSGIDFECMFDSALLDTPQADGTIQWGEQKIDTIIIPPSEPLDEELQSFIEQFESHGGTVIRVPGLDEDQYRQLKQQVADKRVACLEDGGESAGVIVHRRLLEDGSILCFACNATTVGKPSAELVFPETMHVSRVDLEQPGFIPVSDAVVRDGRTVVKASFTPHDSAMFYLTPKPLKIKSTKPEQANASPANTITPGTEWSITSEKDNVLKLMQFLPIRVPGTTRLEVHARVTCDQPMDTVKLLLEGKRYSRIRVNHVDVTDGMYPYRYFDSDQYAVDIARLLRQGENRISMEYDPEMEDVFISGLMACAGIQTILPHLFLIGDFSVTPERHLAPPAKTLNTGAWQPQGFPDYAGTIQYKTTFHIDPSQVESKASLVCDVAGGCVEVFVNNVLCGTRIWAPYRVDITSALHAGENKLTLAVTNTAMDLLRALPAELFTDNPQYFLRDNNLRTPPSGLLDARIELAK